MEFTTVNTGRHSVRDFSPRTIAHDDLRQIVQAAQQAPSWVNSQPWQVYVATASLA